DAMSELNIALSLSENSVDVHMQIAMMLQSKGDFEGAIEHLKFCLEDNMEDQDALYELAFCYDVLDRHEESIEFYLQYIDSDPYSYAAWYNLGNAYHKLELYEMAIDAYDYAILIKENFASAYFNKGNALVNIDRFKDRKSTRLNSSHVKISYAVFCLKKKIS